MDRATMGDQEAADRGDGVGFDLNYPRLSDLIQRFWSGRALTDDELAELDRLNRSHAANVWEMTANNDKEIECPQTNGT